MAFDFKRILKGILIKNDVDETKRLTLGVSNSATTATTTTIESAQTANRTITFPDRSGEITLDSQPSATFGNLNITGNTISSTDTNGNIILSPNGSGVVDVASSKITNVATPTSASDAATMQYVDDATTGSGGPQFQDDLFRVTDNSDTTKKLAFEVSGITTLTTRTLTVPDANITIPSTIASGTLNNLGVTALNADILPASNATRSLGSASLSYLSGFFDGTVKLVTSAAAKLTLTGTNTSTPSGASAPSLYNDSTSTGNNRNLGIFTSSSAVNDANAVGNVYIEGGNKSAGTGNGGSVFIRPGTSAGGVAGSFNVNSSGAVSIDAPIVALIGATTITGSLTQTGVTTYSQNSAPTTPSSGTNKFYVKSDNEFYQLDSDGFERIFGVPVGTSLDFNGRTAPSGYLMEFGQNVSRTTYSKLFNVLCPSLGNFTVTIATPAVFTLTSHGLSFGDRIRLSTTGALPTGLTVNTDYYVIEIDANTFNVASTFANAMSSTALPTSGSQSGIHSAQAFPHGAGDGSTSFGIPDKRGRGSFGRDDMGGTPISRITYANSLISGRTLGHFGGDENTQTHTHVQPSHNHAVKNAQGSVTEPSNGTAQGLAALNTAGTGYVLTAAGAGLPFIEGTIATNDNYGAGSSQNMTPANIVNKIIKY